MSKFYKLLFFNLLIIGSIITLSAYSWMMMWMGMEINLMAFIPIILNLNSSYSSEATMKYFIVQTLASTMLIFSFILLENSLFLSMEIFKKSSLILLFSALLLKLGMPPFHSWFPEVIEGLNWNSSLLILTWQKIAPMSILMMSMKNSPFLTFSIILSSLMGGILGLNQNSIRKLMAYSSINHMAWMLMSMMNSLMIWMIYFMIYSFSSFSLIFYFSKLKIYKINQINSNNSSKFVKMIILMNFLSLGGLPPFIGFFPKWMVISWMVENNLLVIPVILILTTLISIYFYMRILFPTFMLKSSEKKIFNKKKLKNYYFMFLNCTFLSLLTVSSIMF